MGRHEGDSGVTYYCAFGFQRVFSATPSENFCGVAPVKRSLERRYFVDHGEQDQPAARALRSESLSCCANSFDSAAELRSCRASIPPATHEIHEYRVWPSAVTPLAEELVNDKGDHLPGRLSNLFGFERVILILVEAIHSPKNTDAATTAEKLATGGHSTPKNALGPALAQIRACRGWSLEDASAKLRSVGMGCTARQLQRIESQETGIRDFEILYFCSAFEVTQDDLAELLKQAMARLAVVS
jgi:hypothetical protein